MKILLILLALVSFIVITVKKLYINKKNENSTLPNEENLDPAFNISYKEAKILLNTSSIEEKDIMIDESIGKINTALNKFENFSSELVPISLKSYEIPFFLKNATNSSLEIVKNDLELYISIFDELIKSSNNITNISSKSINNISSELNDMKKYLNKIKSEFEEMTRKLSIPLILEQMLNDLSAIETNIDKEDELENEINNYKGNITDFYVLLSRPFEYFLWCYTNIPNIIGEYAKDSVLISSNIIQVTAETYENFSILESSNAHNILIKTKNSLLREKEKVQDIYNNFNTEYKEFENSYESINSFYNFEEFMKNYTKIVITLKSIINSIKDRITDKTKNIKDFNYVMPNIIIQELIQEEFWKLILELFKNIKIIQDKISGEMNRMIETIDVEAKTSLDLLFTWILLVLWGLI